MTTWRALILAIVAAPAAAQPPEAHYDEAKVPAYTLPDPLRFEDGRPVTSPEAWRGRRAEILQLFEEHVYGRSPGPPQAMRFAVVETSSKALSSLATRRQVRVLLGGTKSGPAFELLLYVPNAAPRPVPAFLGLNFAGNHTVHPDPGIRLATAWMRNGPGVVEHRASESGRGSEAAAWPVERILARGYALATVYYGDLEPDHAEGWREGARARIGPGTSGRFAADDWGAIAAGRGGCRGALDYLETSPDVDGRGVAVIGHSRLGKTALWAGAPDELFAMVVSNDSGEGGAALARRKFGERTEDMTRAFPHWFCPRYREYVGREEALPVDQHQLLALASHRVRSTSRARAKISGPTRGASSWPRRPPSRCIACSAVTVSESPSFLPPTARWEARSATTCAPARTRSRPTTGSSTSTSRTASCGPRAAARAEIALTDQGAFSVTGRRFSPPACAKAPSASTTALVPVPWPFTMTKRWPSGATA